MGTMRSTCARAAISWAPHSLSSWQTRACKARALLTRYPLTWSQPLEGLEGASCSAEQHRLLRAHNEVSHDVEALERSIPAAPDHVRRVSAAHDAGWEHGTSVALNAPRLHEASLPRDFIQKTAQNATKPSLRFPAERFLVGPLPQDFLQGEDPGPTGTGQRRAARTATGGTGRDIPATGERSPFSSLRPASGSARRAPSPCGVSAFCRSSDRSTDPPLRSLRSPDSGTPLSGLGLRLGSVTGRLDG